MKVTEKDIMRQKIQYLEEEVSKLKIIINRLEISMELNGLEITPIQELRR